MEQKILESEIRNNGLIEVEGMKFHEIEGGFGQNQKSMLVKEIAKIHGMELKVVNQNINRNRKRFAEGIDIIDLKNGHSKLPLEELGFSSRDISISKNIYLLSERGYSKLLKILEDDFAWEQYEKLVDGYFNMRKELKEIKLDSYMISDPIKRAELWIEEEKHRLHLVETVERQKPLVQFAETCQTSKDSILIREMAKIISKEGFKIGQQRLYEKLREWNLIIPNSTEPYQKYIDRGYFEVKEGNKNVYDKIVLYNTTKITPKGQIYIINKFKKELA